MPLAKRLKLPLDAGILLRTKPRPAQLVLPRTEHWKSVRGAYATRAGARVDNLRVLLVDDVLTTGATLDACARALKKAGAAALGLTEFLGDCARAVTAELPRSRSKPGSSAGHL